MEEQKFQMDFAGRPLVIEVGKLANRPAVPHWYGMVTPPFS